MSAMPTNIPQTIQNPQDDPADSPQIPDSRSILKQNAARTDEAVAVNRATNPGDALANARKIRRLSMAELNKRDSADLERMMDEIQYDPRGPVTKVLDVIDLPRNTIANIVAPGIAAKKRKAGDTGTFGMGKVTFSDYLEELGMRPGIARAVLGFAGDVLTDPLTYAGPGAITKLAVTMAGRAGVQVGRSGVKALESARKAIAAGKGFEGIADPAAKALYQAFHGSVPLEELAARSGELSESFLGKVAGVAGEDSAKGRLAKTAKWVLGLDTERGGSVIADYLAKNPLTASPKELPKIEAVRAFVAKHGKATPGMGENASKWGVRFDKTRGLSIGDGGSQIAHVPFTNFGINVPAFTGAGDRAVTAAATTLAKAGNPSILVHDAYAQTRMKHLIEYRNKIDELSATAQAQANLPSSQPTLQTIEELRLAARQAAEDIRESSLAALRSQAGKKLEINDVLEIGNHYQKARAIADLAATNEATDPLLKYISDALREVDARNTVVSRDPLIKVRDKAKETFAKAEKINEQLNGPTDIRAERDYAAALSEAGPDGRLTVPRPAGLGPNREEVVGKLGDYLMDLTDTNIETRAASADAWLSRVDALDRLANTSAAQLMEVGGRGDRVLETWARDFLKLSDDAAGAHAFLPIYRVFQQLERDGDAVPLRYLEQAGASTRSFFGNRANGGNFFNDVRRVAESRISMGSRHDALSFIQPLRDKFKAIGIKHGLEDADIDKLNAAIHGMVIDRVDTARKIAREALDPVTDLPTGEPSAFMKAIAEAAPLFDDATGNGRYVGLRADVESLVDDFIAKGRELGDQAESLGLLDYLRPSYIQNSFTPEMKQAIAKARLNQSSVVGKTKVASGGDVLEGFQKPRTSDQYRWTGKDGKFRRIFEWDFPAAAITEDALASIPEGAVRDAMLKRIEDVKAFNAHFGNPSEEARRAIAIYTDPFEMNELIKSGRLGGLHAGSALPDGGVNLNPFVALAERTIQQNAAAARMAGKEILDDGAIFASQSILAQTTDAAGKTIKLDNGLEAKVVISPTGQSYIRVAGEPYRQLKVTAEQLKNIDDGSVLSGLMDQRRLHAYYPVKKAEMLERLISVTDNEEQVGKLLKTIDATTKFWKSMTLLHPSWTLGNIIGGVFLIAAMGVDMGRFISYLPKSIKAIYHELTPEAVAGVKANLRGVETTMDRMLHDTDGVVRSVNRGKEFMEGMLPNGDTLETFGLGSPVSRIGDRMARRAAYYYQRMLAQKAATSGSAVDKIRAWASAGKDEAFGRRIMANWAQANAKLEDSMRLAAYMALIDQGESAASAARKVVEGMFDMTDMTAGERATRKYLMPFYTWLRNSGAYGVHLMLQDPKKIAMVPRLKELVEESLNGEANVPEYMRPSWMREQMAVQLGKNPDTRYAFMVGSMIPTETATQFAAPLAAGAEGIGSLAKYALSSVNPIIQTGIALGTGREAYTGRTIGFKPYEGDIRWTDFLAGQIRPIREAVPMGLRGSPLGNAAEAGPGQLAARVLLGGRAQPFDDNRLAYGVARDIRERAEQLRKYITLAEREGKADESLKARAELMAVYRDAVARGREDEVPAWARKMVQERTSSPSAAD